MDSAPPVDAIAAEGGRTWNRHGAPVCASGTWRSATAIDACRFTGSGFSATRKETVPSPCPSTLDVKMIQLTGLVARHEHSRATAIDRVPDPPDEPNDDGGADTVASQREDVGLVTAVEVEAELPQPTAASVATQTANSRDTRVVTVWRLHVFSQRPRLQPTPNGGIGASIRGAACYYEVLQRNTI